MTDLIDRSRSSNLPAHLESVIGDLRDPSVCARVVEGVDTVLHFAANMGGMGTIHEENELMIYQDNDIMFLNMVKASTDAGVKKFLFASSACIYPDSLQRAGDQDVSLAEDDAWKNPPPRPQGLYGLQKLSAELVLHQVSHMQTYIARFHNIFGPHGSWRDGREKVPAALLRKVIAAAHLRDLAAAKDPRRGEDPIELEVWGDGTARRSFCYIDDAVEGIIKLLGSSCHDPVNIGSDHAVSIDELATTAASAVGVDPGALVFKHILDRPVGVGSRNSDNTLVRERLDWSPTVSLQEGMERTGAWIKAQVEELLARTPDDKKEQTLKDLQTSSLVHMSPGGKSFAIILPVTSRTSKSHDPSAPPPCLESLRTFARSLLETTRNDTKPQGESGASRFTFRVYLAVDEDDTRLWSSGFNLAEEALHSEGISDITTIRCNFPRGRVCSLWRRCAQQAWKDGCDYFVLMGDDITLHTDNWMSTIDDTFDAMAKDRKVPTGFGCVAFTDTTFPGMPTFPIVHRTHLDIFHGQVVPDVFVNQDGDPFLFQLYRRFGCSTTVDCELRNALGGSDTARYEKEHAKDWTLGPLSEATSVVEEWLETASRQARMLTLDVVVPCYRVQMAYVDRFLALEPSPTCSVMFIIVVDNPSSPAIHQLEQKYGHRMDVRIRVNSKNLGASASRNRGLSESAAEWVLFLDDDVEPEEDLLVEMEDAIRASPQAAGFVGNAYFPIAKTVFTSALHLAGVLYFWNIADKISRDVPWGVTAVLAARRNVNDGVVSIVVRRGDTLSGMAAKVSWRPRRLSSRTHTGTTASGHTGGFICGRKEMAYWSSSTQSSPISTMPRTAPRCSYAASPSLPAPASSRSSARLLRRYRM